MATIVVMPQLGNSVESCIIVEWMIAEGDTVAVDQTLASIETDKSTMEVPSTAEGTVLKLLWEEGDEVPVKDPLIIVGEPGEDISGLVPGGDAAPVEDAPDKATAPPEQAASPTTIAERMATYADHFWLIEDEGGLLLPSLKVVHPKDRDKVLLHQSLSLLLPLSHATSHAADGNEGGRDSRTVRYLAVPPDYEGRHVQHQEHRVVSLCQASTEQGR